MSTAFYPKLRPELLAPAGDWEALRAAVANGADAVYFGLSDFNARRRAANFTLEELPQVLRYLHDHNVRGYVTFNTLIFSDELPKAAEFLKALATAGADAVIVQDLGIVRLVHRLAPNLPVHGSTQMTLTEPRGIEFARQLGVERVILARELSIPEIRRIREQTDVPVEVFVHGALCVSYSGQCLTSESVGGRSANRGQCAQACRLPYEMIVDGQIRNLGDRAYLLSPQDLAAPDLIGEMVDAGVACFKIEGRLKSAHYVAQTSQTYRAALDAALEGRSFALTRQEKLDLEQSFSRGFSHGFLEGPNHQVLVQGRFPKNRGVRVGTVIDKTSRGVIISMDNGAGHIEDILKPGDGVVFDEGHPEQDEQGGRVFEVRPLVLSEQRRAKNGNIRMPESGAPRQFEVSFGRGDLNLAAVAPGSIVWKTDDPALRRRLEHSYAQDKVARREPLTVRVHAQLGQPLRIQVADASGRTVEVRWEQSLEQAQKHPLTIDLLRDQFGRLGDTPFELGLVTAERLDPVMVPKSVLNDLRRRAVAQLGAQRNETTGHGIADPDALAEFRAEIASRHPLAILKPEQKRKGPHGWQSGPTDEDKADGPIRGTATQSEKLSPVAPLTNTNVAFEPRFYVLVRTLEQLTAALEWPPPLPELRLSMVYCDFEDVRRYQDAVAKARLAGIPIALGTLRIIKPTEEGLLRQIARYEPDAVLIRNLASLSFFRAEMPQLPLIGDYALNVANEITADLLAGLGLKRLVPSYDLNWKQLAEMLGRIDPGLFEVVIHQHMPMFHTEHCVFAALLSNGKDYRDCGRPCDRHRVDLRDRVGADNPVVPDVGCRNTVYNALAQSASEFVPEMKGMGLKHFRVELLRETASEAKSLLTTYARVVGELEDGRRTWRQLRVLNQLGVTRGTLSSV